MLSPSDLDPSLHYNACTAKEIRQTEPRILNTLGLIVSARFSLYDKTRMTLMTLMVEEVQGGLEAKSERICQLRASLNVTNYKHSRLLREDLEKTVEELRQGMYKRTGVKSSSEGRALRSIQVRERGIIFLVSLCVASY